MSTPSFKYGNGVWATKEGSSLAYNDDNGYYKPLPFSVSRASSATRVNKQGLIEVVGNDRLRIDYSESANGVALLEPSRTNYITYSDDFSQWSAINGAVVTDNFVVSPDGSQNAAKVVYDGTVGGKIELNTSASGTNTQSIYLRTESGTQKVTIGASSLDLVEVLVTSEWQRFSHTGTGNYPRVLCSDSTTIYVWGGQQENGSYATSYIPTSGSTATRQADVANGAGVANVFNDSEGVLFAEISALTNDTLVFKSIAISDGTASGDDNRVNMAYYGNNLYTNVRVGNVYQFNENTQVDVFQSNKIALKYKTNDFSVWINGFEVLTDSIGSTFSTGTLAELAFDDGQGNSGFQGKAKAINVYQTALTDAELEYLTSYRSLAEMVTELNLNAL